MIRKLLAATAVAMAMAAVPGVASADPGKDACKDGGYVNYLDPVTGDPFKNQGRCVSFVNGGGALVPVSPEYVPEIVWISPGPDIPGHYTFSVSVKNAEPGSNFFVQLLWSNEGVAWLELVADAQGNTQTVVQGRDCGKGEVYVTRATIVEADGVTEVSAITPPLPEFC